MIRINDTRDCCGCTACASICAHEAITMKPDALGFLYPVVDEGRCTACGLCEKACSFNADYDVSHNLPQPLPYGARHKDMREVATSRSGAAFIALSDCIIEQGGVVYGAGYKEHFHVAHKRAETKEERNEFKGSKYVQSDMRGVFRLVRQDLKDGLTVLFSGTPCQTSALGRFVGEKLRERLYLVDIVCYGVPSPNVWQDYLKQTEKRSGKTISAVDFRNKRLFGWRDHRESVRFTDGEELASTKYTDLFYEHIMFRPSCGNCHFCNTARPSDVTLADFWGWEKTDATANADDKGLSLLLVNTEKGKALFEEAQKQMNVFPALLENCMQGHLKHPSEVHPLSTAFAADYEAYGFEYVARKYRKKVSIAHRVRLLLSKIKRLLLGKKGQNGMPHTKRRTQEMPHTGR